MGDGGGIRVYMRVGVCVVSVLFLFLIVFLLFFSLYVVFVKKRKEEIKISKEKEEKEEVNNGVCVVLAVGSAHLVAAYRPYLQ